MDRVVDQTQQPVDGGSGPPAPSKPTLACPWSEEGGQWWPDLSDRWSDRCAIDRNCLPPSVSWPVWLFGSKDTCQNLGRTVITGDLTVTTVYLLTYSCALQNYWWTSMFIPGSKWSWKYFTEIIVKIIYIFKEKPNLPVCERLCMYVCMSVWIWCHIFQGPNAHCVLKFIILSLWFYLNKSEGAICFTLKWSLSVYIYNTSLLISS